MGIFGGWRGCCAVLVRKRFGSAGFAGWKLWLGLLRVWLFSDLLF
jgi:hypothetical protein